MEVIIMAYYANQKTVKINKPEPERNKARVIIDREQLEAAAKELTGNEFKLYMFFASDNDGFKRDFSPAHFADVYGVSADTTRKLFKQLEEKGFLQQDENKKNLYQFYLLPQKKLDIEVSIERRRIVEKDGTEHLLTFEEFLEGMKGSRYTEEQLKKAYERYELV